ncbi:MAG: hypothetical protein K1X67_14080 [Fimbriimonadaceae bacterium]|nr:hypothetical protein [Fimbriimonadaceae bacterium]
MPTVSDPADPRRCKKSVGSHQCDRVAAHGSDLCEVCGGKDGLNEHQKRLYVLADSAMHQRVGELANHEAVLSLREEIAITREFLRRRLDLIKNDNEFLMAGPAVQSFVTTIGKLVKEAHTIEKNLDVVLSKATVIILAQSVSRIIAEELDGIEGYEDVVDRINMRMLEAIRAASNKATMPQPAQRRLTSDE